MIGKKRNEGASEWTGPILAAGQVLHQSTKEKIESRKAKACVPKAGRNTRQDKLSTASHQTRDKKGWFWEKLNTSSFKGRKSITVTVKKGGETTPLGGNCYSNWRFREMGKVGQQQTFETVKGGS